MSFTSAGAAITLGGTAVYPAISTLRLGGAGGPVTVRTKITVGTITTVGSGAGGAVILEREVVSGAISASGVGGGAVTLGDECTTGSITSKPLTGPSSGGTITIGDDGVTGAIDNSGTAANTAGGIIVIGDRCEVGAISSSGITGGGAVTIGEGLTSGSITTAATTSGNGGALIISHRPVITGTITTSGITNAGAITIGANAFISGVLTGNGAAGTSGPISIGDGSHYSTLTATAGTNAGLIDIGKFCVLGTIAANSATTSGLNIGDGTTISGTVTMVTTGASGNVLIGSAVTITGDLDIHSTASTAGSVTTGRGCNLAGVRAYANASTGGVTIGASTTATIILANNGGGGGTTAGNISLGAGATVQDVYANSFNPGGNSGSVTMEPGAVAAFITVASNTGTGGNVVMKNSNSILGMFSTGILMGTSNTGAITAINPRIMDFIDNITSTTIIRDGVFSTPAGNRSCIADVLANGAQFTNCLFVPNGTGFSITASAPRTIIGYQILHKNGYGPNVSASEGSDTVSANLLAP